MAMTPAQKRVYDFIVDYILKNNYPPTTREIQRALGYASQNSACQHIKALTRRGYIKADPRKARAISITQPTNE
jgi:repressor LexA